MVSDWLKVLLSDDYEVCGMSYYSKNRNFYKSQSKDLKLRGEKSYSIKDVIIDIKCSSRFSLLKNELNKIKKEFIYKSDGHGLNHNERVALFTFYLANAQHLSDRDLKLALYGAFYHDIGRRHDYTDDYHGEKSAELICNLGLNITDEEMDILKTVVTCHSLDDSRFESIVKKNKVKNVKRCEVLFKILKDSDALDRVRLDENPVVIPSMLRFDESRRIILAAYQLFENYEQIKESLEEEKSC